MISFAKSCYARAYRCQATQPLKPGTYVGIIFIVGIQFGQVLRQGYGFFADYYRVKDMDGSEFWVEMRLCTEVNGASG